MDNRGIMIRFRTGTRDLSLIQLSRPALGSKRTGVKTQEINLTTSIKYGTEEQLEMNGNDNVNK
jgi:hypothetical protein